MNTAPMRTGFMTAGLFASVLVLSCSRSAPAPTSPTPSTPSTSAPTGALEPPGVVLGRPTDRSLVASVRAATAMDVYVEFGTTAGVYTTQTPVARIDSGAAVTLPLDGLRADTGYTYRTRYRAPGETAYRTGAEHPFRTQRSSGATFRFVVQADSHLDDNTGTAVYEQALRNMVADTPDFLVDLGDTSMVDKCSIAGSSLCSSPAPATEAAVQARMNLARGYLEQAAHSMPLFLVLGNHDGEAGWPTNPASLDLWSVSARKALFPNPEPDRFYSASSDAAAGVGLRQNYYAFEWGDALFVAVDPFTYTARKPGANGWGWTLGPAQYQWLAQTLASSRARFKFVFSHHILGGSGQETRGGAAFGRLYEWGGRNADGTWAFDRERPGWTAPIQQLFVDNKVTAWFHGHDHLYAREELDGVVYQAVPQPSLARYDVPDPAAGYGYLGSVGNNIFSSSGHLRVTVSPTDVRVDYVRAVAPGDVTATRQNGAVVTSYVIR